MTRKGILIFAAVISLSLTGCGNHSPSSSNPGSSPSTVPPPLRFIQQTGYGTAGPAAQSSFSAAFGGTVTSGNLIAVAIVAPYSIPRAALTVVSVTDSAGNYYAEAARKAPLWVYYATNAAGGDHLTVTVTLDVAAYSFSMACLEYSGVNAVDVTATAMGAVNAGSPFSSGSATTNYGNEVILGAAFESGAGGGLPGPPSASFGFNGRFMYSGFGVEDEIVSATGSYSAAFLPSGDAVSWTAVMVTFSWRPQPKPPSRDPSGIHFIQAAGTTGCVQPCYQPLSFSAGFTDSVARGDLVAVAIAGYYGAGASVVVRDSAGNNYTMAAQASTADGNPVWIYYTSNVVDAGDLTVTVNISPTPYQFYMAILDYSGVNTLDVTAAKAAAGSDGSVFSAGATSTNYPNELILGAARVDGPECSAASGFNSRLISDNWGGFCVEDKIVSTTGSYDVEFLTPTSAPWAAIMATFR